MGFGGTGGGSSSIAGATDAAISSPNGGQLLAYNSSLGKWQNKTVASGGSGSTELGEYATFTWDGTTATAIVQADGSAISSGSTPAAVLQAAVTACGNAGGGLVRVTSSAGAIPINQSITMAQFTGLIGSGAWWSQGNVISGTVLVASGSLGSGDAIIKAGTGSTATLGVAIIGMGLDGNNQTMGWHTLNANCPIMLDCVVVNGSPICVWFESSIAPNPLPGGGFGANCLRCIISGSAVAGATVTCVKSSGVGATDGHISDCTFHIRAGGVGADVAGGWVIGGCHLTGTSVTTADVVLNGANSVLVGNYFDTAKAGHNVVINQPFCVVSSNYVLNGGANTLGTSCIQINSLKGTVTNNVLDTNNVGYGITTNGTGAPGGGVVTGNYCSGIACFVDSTGNTVPTTSTNSTYVAGNVFTSS